MKPEIEKILWKNQNGFWKNWSTTSDYLSNQWRSTCKKSHGHTIVYRFSQGIWFHTQMILYRNRKAKVRSLDWDLVFFDIVIGVLQGDTLAPYLLIICLDCVNRKWLYAKKVRSRQYPTEIITDTDYADNVALANTPAQTKSLLHSLELTTGGIGLHMNTNKIVHVF